MADIYKYYLNEGLRLSERIYGIDTEAEKENTVKHKLATQFPYSNPYQILFKFVEQFLIRNLRNVVERYDN
jgi:hypothetical protein